MNLELNSDGYLDPGIYEMTIEEVGRLFGRFSTTERRPILFSKLEKLVDHANSTGIVKYIIVDGSFVTSKESPNDIDLIIALDEEKLINIELNPNQLNLISRKRSKNIYKFDIFSATDNSDELNKYISFFSQVRHDPNYKKGLIRINCVN